MSMGVCVLCESMHENCTTHLSTEVNGIIKRKSSINKSFVHTKDKDGTRDSFTRMWKQTQHFVNFCQFKLFFFSLELVFLFCYCWYNVICFCCCCCAHLSQHIQLVQFIHTNTFVHVLNDIKKTNVHCRILSSKHFKCHSLNSLIWQFTFALNHK